MRSRGVSTLNFVHLADNCPESPRSGLPSVIVAKYLEVVVRDATRACNWSLVLHRSISLNRESLHIYISEHMHTTKEQSGASTGLR